MTWTSSMQSKKRGQRDALIEEYRGFVNSVVRKLIHSMNLPTELYDEFVGAGYLGLVEAADRFDRKDGTEFKHYAYLRIRGSVIDSIRECSDVSGKAYRYAKALQAANMLREGELDEWNEKNIKDLARAEVVEDPELKLAHVLDYAAKSALAFRMTVNDAEHEMTEGADPADAESKMIARQDSQEFFGLVETLPPKERLIIEEYYFKGKSFAEIVETHKEFSKGWVSRLHARALTMLKEKYEELKIQERTLN